MIDQKVIPSYPKPSIVHAGTISRLGTIEAIFARADTIESAARYVEKQSANVISPWNVATR